MTFAQSFFAFRFLLKNEILYAQSVNMLLMLLFIGSPWHTKIKSKTVARPRAFRNGWKSFYTDNTLSASIWLTQSWPSEISNPYQAIPNWQKENCAQVMHKENVKTEETLVRVSIFIYTWPYKQINPGKRNIMLIF